MKRGKNLTILLCALFLFGKAKRKVFMKPYGLIDKKILFNNNLSLEAKGIYGLIMSFDSERINVEEIYKLSLEDKEVVDRAIDELQSHGYVFIEK